MKLLNYDLRASTGLVLAIFKAGYILPKMPKIRIKTVTKMRSVKSGWKEKCYTGYRSLNVLS